MFDPFKIIRSPPNSLIDHPLNKKVLINQFIDLVIQFSYYMINVVYFKLFFHNLKTPSKNLDILFSSFLLNWRETKHKDGTSCEYDIMIGDVIEKAEEDGLNVLCIDTDSKKRFRSKSKTVRKISTNSKWICLEQFITFSIIFKALILDFKMLTYGLPDNKYDKYVPFGQSSAFRAVLFLLVSEQILDQVQPKVVFLTCEYCEHHRELTYIAHTKKIPVIALQHGIITKEHLGYIYTDERLKAILPNITCVFGQKHYNLLTQNSIYDPDMVAITGSPRYDILAYAEKMYSREHFIKKYGISQENKIVLWTTQCHGISDKENKNNFKAMFETVQNLKDVTLIIKQHPGEGEKYTKMIKDALKNHNLNIVITPKSSDTYEQLYMCDILVIKDSTTAMEAVVLNKPVIVLNLSGEPEIVEYVTEKVALGVYNENDLKPTLERLLENDADLEINRNLYIDKYLYKIDGNSTERVLRVIENQIN